MYALPTTLSQDALSQIVKAFSGDLSIETAHAAWEVAGFAIKQVDPNHPVMHAAAPLTMQSAEAHLTSMAADPKAINWQLLLQIATMILSLFVQPKP